MDESEKIRYRRLKNELDDLKMELEGLLSKDNQLNGKLKETIVIDDNILEEDKIKDIFFNNININNELENKIIPVIRSKC